MRSSGLLLLGLLSACPSPGAGVPGEPILALDARGHTAMIVRVLFTPDGRELVTASYDKTVRVWDARTGEPLRVLRPPIGPGRDGMLFAAALSPDGRTLAVAGFGWTGGETPIDLIALDTGRMERVLDGHTDLITGLAFAPDGTRLASVATDRTARIWDVAGGRCERVLEGHSGGVYGVAFSPDGRLLATASHDATARVWSVDDGRCVQVLRGHAKEVQCVAWRPDGRVLATGGLDRSIRLWGPGGESYGAFDGRRDRVMSLEFAADSRGLLYTWGGTADDGAGAALLDPASGRDRVRFTRHTNTVLSGALSPDGTLAATVGGNDKEGFLWRTADGSAVVRFGGRGRGTWSAAWGPDGRTIAWGHTDRASADGGGHPLERAFRPSDLEFAGPPDATYRRARRASGPLTLEIDGASATISGRGGDAPVVLKMASRFELVHCATLLPGDRAALGTEFGLHLYDTRTGAKVRDLLGHTGIVRDVAASPDGRYLLSASNDMTLRIWAPERPEPLLSLFFAGDDWIAWTPEGYYAASPGGEGLVGWHVNDGPDRMASFYPAEKFRKTLYRPDVIRLLLEAGGTARALEAADRALGRRTGRGDAAAVLPPTVEVEAPRHGTIAEAPGLEVRAVARARGGRPVTALRLLLDGRPYKGQAGLRAYDPPRAGEVRESWDVELVPGTHRLAVQAESAVSRATSDAVEVTVAAEARREALDLPALYVLAVGIAEYPGDLRLNYAAKDAEAIERAFRDGGRTLFRAVEVRRLSDGQATRKAILGGLTWLRKQMTQKDVGVVFFSGHGQRDSEGSLYLLPVDVDTEDLLSSAVGDAQVKAALAGLPGRVIALLDACHAGAAGGDRRKTTGGLTDDLVRDLVTDDYGVVVMASSTGREFSLENNAKRQSNFTLAIVEGLEGKADYNKDGVVYLNELDAYITERVKELTKGQQHPVTAKPTSIRSFPLAKP